MSYGVMQEYYTTDRFLQDNQSATGAVGTTFNGIVYLSIPLLFAAFTNRWARFRAAATVGGVVLTGLGYLLSSFSSQVWHVVATQGVLVALGSALLYSPATLTLGEWYATGNRALAYGVILSCKNVVGSTCPFLLRALLDRHGFRRTLQVWAAVAVASSLLALGLTPARPPSLTRVEHRARRLPWRFLRHRTFWIYSAAIVLQTAGYGIPQTYLNSYAHDAAALSETSATLLLTLFHLPGSISSSFFGYLSNGRHFSMSASTTTAISALSSAGAALVFWGLGNSMALLALFSVVFGFFAGGYSATWGGVINEMEQEAADQNEAIDTGVLYGLLNGARGFGYVGGGLAGVALLNSGSASGIADVGYRTEYSPLIIFTGLSTMFGGWSVCWQARKIFA